MAGYILQGKTQNGEIVYIPLSATYDSEGNEISTYYALRSDYENIMSQLAEIKENIEEIKSKTLSNTAATDEEMAALLSEDNEGRVVKFTGAESEIYDENEYYLIEEDN